MRYPEAPRLDVVDEIHGHLVADPYRWLEDASAPDTVAWSEAQDAICREHLDALPGRDRVRERITALLGAGYVGVPTWRGDRCFFMRRNPDQEHAVLLVREADGSERVLVDPTALSPDGLTTLDAYQPSKEGYLIAVQTSHGGTEESQLEVLDVATGERVDGPIDRTRYSPVAWLPGAESFYYVRRLPPEDLPEDESQYHRRVWLHRLGTSADDDVMVWGDGLEKTNYYGVSVSLDGRWLVVSASAGTAPRNDLWLADLAGDALLQPVQVGVDAQTSLQVRDGRAYVFTDRDAPRGRLCVTTPDRPAYEHWTDLVPESDAVLEGYALTSDALVVLHTRHAVSGLTVLDRASGAGRHTVALPGLATVSGISARPEGGTEAWFGYTDHGTPSRVLHLDALSGEVDVWAEPPGHVELPDLEAMQVFVPSGDGTLVPVFVLSQPGIDLDGSHPTVLYGYGGFNVSMNPGYSAGITAWVEAGGVYAIACLRGGSEYGEEWHRAGMRGQKQNVFDDLHAVAEHLCATGWTSPQRLGIAGGSNGGLLVGAALTQRPELYAAVVCSAPLLDMVRYEQFGLGATWNDEYGRADDPEELGWLLGYSPYHRVTEGADYPAVLFTIFDSDTRVDPLHARKMAAALQHATASERPILVRRETDVGHGARSVSRSVELSVDTTTFLAEALGLPL